MNGLIENIARATIEVFQRQTERKNKLLDNAVQSPTTPWYASGHHINVSLENPQLSLISHCLQAGEGERELLAHSSTDLQTL